MHIYRLDTAGQCIGDSVVFGDIPGISSVCFTLRNGVETVLVLDLRFQRIVEIDLNGVLIRHIELGTGIRAVGGLAFCGTQDLIAVSSFWPSDVFIINYSGEEVTRVGGFGHRDGELCGPLGVSFTADGLYLLVADNGNNRVSKFRALDGTFITHLAIGAVFRPMQVSEYEDGLLVVGRHEKHPSIGLFLVGTGNPIFTYKEDDNISYCEAFVFASSGKIAVNSCGVLFFLSDIWSTSDRAAWVCACSVV